MSDTWADRIATNLDLGTETPVYMFDGEAKIITEPFKVGGDLAERQVFALNANSEAVPHDPLAVGPEAVAVGIACFAVTAAQNQYVSGYTSGVFNSDALVWHPTLATLEQRRAAFRRTMTKIGGVRAPKQIVAVVLVSSDDFQLITSDGLRLTAGT